MFFSYQFTYFTSTNNEIMNEAKNSLPTPHTNVMLTYNGYVRVRDKYYDRKVEQVVTRRAFFCNSDGYFNKQDEWVDTPNGYFAVPQYWENFHWSDGTVTLSPKGFWQYPRVMPEEVLSWEYDK